MTEMLNPDLCIVGDSAGGVRAAVIAAAFGLPTILVRRGATDEQRAMQLGSLAAAAAAYHSAQHSTFFGINTGEFHLDFSLMMQRVRDRERHIGLRTTTARFQALGIRVIDASAEFESTRVLRAGGHRIAARRFILALDDEADSSALQGVTDTAILSPENLDRLHTLPRSLALVGGQAEALAYAQIFRRLGVSVHLLAPDGLLPLEDREQASILSATLQREGVSVHAHKRIHMLTREGDHIRIGMENGVVLDVDHVLSLARCPSPINSLGLARAGIGSGANGLHVSRGLRTENPAVFAIGPCTITNRDGQGLAAGRAQADLVMRNILFRLPISYDPAHFPRVVSSRPGYAAVGLSEREARDRHGGISVLRSAFSDNDEALAEEHREGHAKILLDRRGRLLGASLTGPGVAALITPWGAALGTKPNSIRNAIPPAPSLAETPRRALQDGYAPLARNKTVRFISGLLRRLG